MEVAFCRALNIQVIYCTHQDLAAQILYLFSKGNFQVRDLAGRQGTSQSKTANLNEKAGHLCCGGSEVTNDDRNIGLLPSSFLPLSPSAS